MSAIFLFRNEVGNKNPIRLCLLRLRNLDKLSAWKAALFSECGWSIVLYRLLIELTSMHEDDSLSRK